jgi:hypothetical protein
VPQVAPLQPAPAKDQFTPWFCESFCTVAVKACVLPVCTLALGGVMLTEISGGVTPVLLGSPDPHEARNTLTATAAIRFLRLPQPIIKM